MASVHVDDGRGGSADGSGSLTVGTMTGRWTLSEGGGQLSGMLLALVQVNGTITGNMALPGINDSLPADQPGQITEAATVTLPVRVRGHIYVLGGAMDTTGTRVTGTVNDGGVAGAPFVLMKQ